MYTYGNVELLSNTLEIQGFHENLINNRDVYQFETSWGLSKFPDVWNTMWRPLPQVRVGSLFHPVGASRWSLGHFFASKQQVDLLRKKTISSGSPIPLDFVFNDGAGSKITTSLYMMVPKPLTFWNMLYKHNGEDVYLLTLVDKRFFWWMKHGVIESGGTWNELYQEIASILKEAITVDEIDARYKTPSLSFASEYAYLPPVLDLVAHSLNQRIVVNFDGTVIAQNVVNAEKSQKSMIDKFSIESYRAGGFYQYGN